jgi:hypothetical protein
MKSLMLVSMLALVLVAGCQETTQPTATTCVPSSTMSPSAVQLYRAEHKGNNPPAVSCH